MKPSARSSFVDRGAAVQRQADRAAKTFADQAVIAIENVRLFEEVQARNRELTRSAGAADGDGRGAEDDQPLGVRSGPVLDTLVEVRVRPLSRDMGCIYLRDGDVFRPAMQVGWTPEFYECHERHPMRPGRGSVTGRVPR